MMAIQNIYYVKTIALTQLPSQPLANPRNVGQASSSRTHNVNEVRIDGAPEEAHTISGLRSGKVLVDPHTDHKCRKDPLQERDDGSFSCVVKTQRRWSNKIYKTELTKTRYNNQELGKYWVDPQRAGLTLIAELTGSNLGLKGVLNK